MQNNNDFSNYRTFAEKLATKVGEKLLEKRSSVRVLQKKKTEDLLTSADLLAQKEIVRTIKKEFPKHGIIAEENSLEEKAELTWVVDPLEGTKYYVKGLNNFSTDIALLYKGEPVVSAIYRPASKTLYSSSPKTALLNGRSISVSSVKDLNKSMVYSTLPNSDMGPDDFERTSEVNAKLFKSTYRTRYQAECNLAMCWIAQGAFEAYVEASSIQKIWDSAPGLSMVKAAGGKVSTLKGERLNIFNLKEGIISSNGLVHKEIIDTIA